MEKKGINIPMNWALTQIIYNYDEITKSDIVARAIEHNDGKVYKDYISKKLIQEYPDRSLKQFLEPELTNTGRRQLLHVNVPINLHNKMMGISESCNLSISKTVACMMNQLYDSGKNITPIPKKTRGAKTQRIAINFPIETVKEVMEQYDFRGFVLRAVEEYVEEWRSLDGGKDYNRDLGQ